MATVIRVKRKLSLDPAEAVVVGLSFKRTKPSAECSASYESTSGQGNSKSLYCYSGTVNCIEETTKHVRTAQQLRTSFKKPQTKDPQQTREEQVLAMKNRRYKIISEHRQMVEVAGGEKDASGDVGDEKSQKPDIQEVTVTENDEDKAFWHMVDVEVQGDDDVITCNGIEMEKESVGANVYDIYTFGEKISSIKAPSLGENEELESRENEQYIDSIRDPSFYMQPVYHGSPELSDKNSEDDDSNDEDNWRNDYPDEADSDESEEQRYSDDDEYDTSMHEKLEGLELGDF